MALKPRLDLRQSQGLALSAQMRVALSVLRMSPQELAEEIAPWRTSKGTLQFPPDALPPDDLIRRMVAARIAENLEKKAARKAARKKVAAPDQGL